MIIIQQRLNSIIIKSSTSACVTTIQSPSPTSTAKLIVMYQRWHHQATPGPRVLSAPSSQIPGGKEHKERCEQTLYMMPYPLCHCPVDCGLNFSVF